MCFLCTYLESVSAYPTVRFTVLFYLRLNPLKNARNHHKIAASVWALNSEHREAGNGKFLIQTKWKLENMFYLTKLDVYVLVAKCHTPGSNILIQKKKNQHRKQTQLCFLMGKQCAHLSLISNKLKTSAPRWIYFIAPGAVSGFVFLCFIGWGRSW